MSSCNHLIKQQLEQILKDTKILCELEPFVKKWSLEETFPNFEDDTAKDSRQATISEILQTGQEAESENNSAEKILRKIKEVMSSPKSNNSLDDQYDSGHGHLIPSHQSYNPPDETLLGKRYTDELESTLKTLEKIEAMDAVSPRDIEEYRRGVGKPDGPEFDKTTMQEWKNVFMEQWLHLDQPSRYQKEALIKDIIQSEFAHNAQLRSSVPILARPTLRTAEPNNCTSSRGTLDSSFMLKRGNKNITPSNIITLPAQKRPNTTLPSSSHSTYLPNPHYRHHQQRNVGNRAQTALETRKAGVLTLRGGSNKIGTSYLEKEKKGASSANKRMMMGMTVPPEYKKGATSSGSKQLARNVHYSEQGQATKKLVNKNNTKGWDAGNTLRSSTAIKTNIEIQRFKEKTVKARPATSIPSPAKPNRYV